MGESLLILPREFGHVEKISEGPKGLPDQQGHDSVHARQTPAGNVGEEAGQSPRRRKRLLSHGKNRVMQPHWVQSRAIAQLSK